MSAAPPTLEIRTTAEDHRVARLAALAMALAVADAAFPSPIPGVKPGLANIVVLVALARYGFRVAAWVSILRVVAAAIAFGSFLTPGFFLSCAGAAASLAMLWLGCRLPSRWFGPVSHSVLAAFAHMAGQLALAAAWLVPPSAALALAPVFAIAALVFGTVNGIVAARWLRGGPLAAVPA
ncbi:MAG TPA: Gx transporter family protein [Pelomicrobium sp.]|nr:Gx transporter family protein [Pelomicrobium sp.]